jgi:ABC-2 type transport system ATP-binding protein
LPSSLFHAVHRHGIEAFQDLRVRFQGAQGHRSRHSPREIFALLGPNGAGKTTLISVICGIVNPTEGKVTVDGHDILTDYRAARSMIGLVPQELTTDAFETVWNAVSFSRGLFGKPRIRPTSKRAQGPVALEQEGQQDHDALRRHEAPPVDRQGAVSRAAGAVSRRAYRGVDVELRRDMWALVRSLQSRGVTIILTTHYIDEAEEMADRVGVISKGEIILVENKVELMRKLGKKQLTLHLTGPLERVPPELADYHLELAAGGNDLIYTFDAQGDRPNIAVLLEDLDAAGIHFKDLQTTQSSLEDIFVSLVREES